MRVPAQKPRSAAVKPKQTLTRLLLPHLRGKGWGGWGQLAHCCEFLVHEGQTVHSPSWCRSAAEPGCVLLGDPGTDLSHSLSSQGALQRHLLTDKKSSTMLTLGESETKRVAASNSQAHTLSNVSADPRVSTGLRTYGSPAQARWVRLRLCFWPQKCQVQLACQGKDCLRGQRHAGPRQAPTDHLSWHGVTAYPQDSEAGSGIYSKPRPREAPW